MAADAGRPCRLFSVAFGPARLHSTFGDFDTIMNKTITAIKRGVKAAVKDTLRPRQFQAGGKPVICSQCSSDGFQWHGHGTFGTRQQARFIEGYALQCCQCSHLEFFGKRPDES